MAKAELEIKITDSGQSAVGRPAPGGSMPAWSQSVAGAQQALKTMGIGNLSSVGNQISKAADDLTQSFHSAGNIAASAAQGATKTAASTPVSTVAPRVSIPAASQSSNTAHQFANMAGAMGQAASAQTAAVQTTAAPAAVAASGSAVVSTFSRIAAVAGPAAVAVGAVAGVATIAVAGLQKFREELNENVATLRRYNGAVAFASARSEMNMVLAEIRRGNVIGDKLAAYETARSKMEIAAFEIWTKILDILTTAFVPFMEFLSKVMQKLSEWLGAQQPAGGVGANPFVQQIFGMALQPLK